MLKQEFEELYGKSVTSDEYTLIEKMYNNCGLDKRAFVQEYKKVGNSLLVQMLAETCESFLRIDNEKAKQLLETSHFLADMAANCKDLAIKEELRTRAINLIGSKEYIKYILAKGYELTELDKECIFYLIDKH